MRTLLALETDVGEDTEQPTLCGGSRNLVRPDSWQTAWGGGASPANYGRTADHDSNYPSYRDSDRLGSRYVRAAEQ